MSRIRWPLLILLVCLPLIYLAAGYRLPGLGADDPAEPRPVPAGDVEIAWFNTTTGGAAWERFVAGAHRATKLVPGLTVHAADAFPDRTTEVPEVVLALADRSNRLRIRWYKLSSRQRPADWIAGLARRDPAPLAVIGGGSSDRARDLALALAAQMNWLGPPPLFFMTSATAERVDLDGGAMTPLLDIYKDRTFRLCFNNRQMAEALLDFVWQNPTLRPQALNDAKAEAPTLFRINWDDDPYSSDLHEQFTEALPAVLARYGVRAAPRVFRYEVPYSVGGFSKPTRDEAAAAESIVRELARLPPQRALLVIPTVPGPARRMIQALAAEDPALARRLVAINGDGMGANTILRDGDYVWPIAHLPIPLVLFTHANPAGWDDDLRRPSSTDDVLQAAELVRLIAANALAGPADQFARRLRSVEPPFFDANGDRGGGTGEYVLLVKPEPTPAVEVWRRTRDRKWQRVLAEPLVQARRA